MQLIRAFLRPMECYAVVYKDIDGEDVGLTQLGGVFSTEEMAEACLEEIDQHCLTKPAMVKVAARQEGDEWSIQLARKQPYMWVYLSMSKKPDVDEEQHEDALERYALCRGAIGTLHDSFLKWAQGKDPMAGASHWSYVARGGLPAAAEGSGLGPQLETIRQIQQMLGQMNVDPSAACRIRVRPVRPNERI